jgi:hypothetical protein
MPKYSAAVKRSPLPLKGDAELTPSGYGGDFFEVFSRGWRRWETGEEFLLPGCCQILIVTNLPRATLPPPQRSSIVD